MAWTSKAERWLPLEPDDVGPGSYGGHPEYHPEPHFAPFGSTKPRDTQQQDFNTQDQQPRSTSPPPGAYDPKLPKAYDSGLPRKKVPFASSAARSSSSTAAAAAPGPGAYDVVPKMAEALSCRTMGAPPSQQEQIFRSLSAPSIPCAHQSHGYEEAGDGRLIRQNPKGDTPSFSGRPGDTIGPGHYNYEVGAIVKRAVNGKFPPVAKSAPEKVDTMPGPGYYDCKRPQQSVITSSFVSTTTQRPKVKKKQQSTVPGPGYYDSSSASRPDLRELHAELQYFGSTTERFKEPPGVKEAPGPGQYQQAVRSKAKSSWIKSERFQQEGKHIGGTPGPGQYNPQADTMTSGPTGTVSILGSTGCLAFGSMESKLPKKRARSGGPGPGAYYALTEELAASTLGSSSASGRSERTRTLAKPPRSQSAVFKSKTPMNAMVDLSIKEGQQMPPPGAYTPTLARDTGTVMRQPPKAEGFLSVERRGQSLDVVAPFAAPGPGKYDTVGQVTGGKKHGTFNRTIVEGAPASGRPTGLGFESQTRRFRGNLGRDTPGPGAYDSNPEWITKTHNIYFGDVG